LVLKFVKDDARQRLAETINPVGSWTADVEPGVDIGQVPKRASGTSLAREDQFTTMAKGLAAAGGGEVIEKKPTSQYVPGPV
jgi:hypothetical protein